MISLILSSRARRVLRSIAAGDVATAGAQVISWGRTVTATTHSLQRLGLATPGTADGDQWKLTAAGTALVAADLIDLTTARVALLRAAGAEQIAQTPDGELVHLAEGRQVTAALRPLVAVGLVHVITQRPDSQRWPYGLLVDLTDAGRAIVAVLGPAECAS